MSSKVLPESELCKSFRGDANQLHTKALLENGGEAYTIFFELYISSVALIFYVIPPKLTVMYSTDESYKTICLTKYIYIYTRIWVSNSSYFVWTADWSGKNKMLINGLTCSDLSYTIGACTGKTRAFLTIVSGNCHL